MKLKAQIQAIAKNKNMTLKDVADKANMSYNGLHNKFKRGSLTVRDLEQLLDVLGKEIRIVDKHE